MTLIVAPAWFVIRLVRRRRWSLKEWLALPAIVALMLASSQLAMNRSYELAESHLVDPEFEGLSILLLAVPGATFLIFPLFLVGSVVRRQWRLVITLFVLSVLAALAFAAISLAIERQVMTEIQSFSWDYWYLVWLVGAYIAGFLALGTLILRGLWRRVFRRKTTLSPAGQ